MSDGRDLEEVTTSLFSEDSALGTYNERLKRFLSERRALLPPDRLLAGAPSGGGFAQWYLDARRIDREALKDLFGRRWFLQGQLDKLTAQLQQDVRAFAEPLLTKALKDTLNLDLDVRATQLRLYVPSTLILGIDSGADHVRHSSLLDAALHNFEAAEAEAGAFSDGSGVFTLDADGTPRRHALSVAQFVALCRTLDLGAQYQAHLNQILNPVAATARVALQQDAVASDKAAFKLAALTALLKGDITDHALGQLLGVHDGTPGRRLYGLPLLNHRLSLMGFRLTGITLFSAVAEPTWARNAVDTLSGPLLKLALDASQTAPVLPGQELERFTLIKAFLANGPKGMTEALAKRHDSYTQSRVAGSLIVYIPDDPVHPLKQYDSFTGFMKTLISQLAEPDYQTFFSRFVAQKDKGLFFKRVNERLKTFTWHAREPLDMGPWWRETAVENPDPQPLTREISGNLWSYLYSERRDKLIADARQIAVPTGDEDAASRWKRLSSYLEIGWNLFNFAAMLVPGLGEAMLGVMVAQLLEELAEGLEDWSTGDREEASAHITSVLINGAQLAMMGAGHVLPTSGLTPIQPSPVLDNLRPVELPDGTPSLWQPDLGPYALSRPLPDTSRPDELGLHHQDGKTVLALENTRYRVSAEPATGQYRIEHPTRPNAYQPRLAHNGAGAWATELEQPLAWDEAKVWRRLGHSLETFPEQTQAQIRTVSGVDHTVVRRLHAEQESPPPLLSDTLKRFKAYAEAEDMGRQILDNQVAPTLEGFLPVFVTELPGWPEARAVEVFDGASLSGPSIKYGNINATAQQTIKVSRGQLQGGELPGCVLDALKEHEIRDLLGARLSAERAERLGVLRARLAMHAGRQTRRLFDSLYQAGERASDAHLRLLQARFPGLPGRVGERLLQQASAEDLRFIEQKRRVPLRVAAQARQALEEVRVVRAYEGLYLKDLANPDTDRLGLHSIAAMPGWSDNLRIEVRDFSFNGALRDSVGPAQAPMRKVLVLDEDGQYEARDALDQHLHGADDLYGALLHALPDAERQALGYAINQGRQLKRAVQDQPLTHESLALILRDAPLRKPAYDPHTMKLRGGMQGVHRNVPGAANVRHRVRSLYPGFSEAELDELLVKLDLRGIPVTQQVSALEAEFNELNNKLSRWVNSRILGMTPSGAARWHARNQVYKALRRCWQRLGPRGEGMVGEDHPQMLNLDGHNLSELLETIPPLRANFDHVTGLSLRNNGLLTNQMDFLKPFVRVRSLDLSGNLLNRLPPVVGDMRYLCELVLTNNQIELSDVAVARLRKLKRLQVLGLTGNPLRRVPDISRMTRLQVLVLRGTGIDTWPAGLFASQRPRNIYLDLRNNPISLIPEVAPGSVRAELLARTQISRSPEWMSAQTLERLQMYIESVGMDPDRPYPPRSSVDGSDWTAGMSAGQWAQRMPTWDVLEDEWGSEPFFNRIRGLTQTADFRAGGDYRVDLTAKVWRMVEAMAQNAELREKLFAEALAPTECVDGLTQVFNAMGIEVLVHEAYQLANPGLVEAQLVSLAQGKSRLAQLDAIARRRVSERLTAGETYRRTDAEGEIVGTIDVVEVHLAYMTDLAARLDLPWQARGMQFRSMAKVTRPMIEAAYERVLALEEGDLLRDSITEVPFWKTWVEAQNKAAFDVLRRKVDLLTEFKVAMDERADATEVAPLNEQLKGLAAALGKPESEIAEGQVMTEEAYDTQLQAILDDMDALLKKLTQDAMDRARLQRVEIPFTVVTDA